MTDMTSKQIKAALDAGILTKEQARAMHVKQAKASTFSDNIAVIGNEDDMRFVRSFSDVFIAIGIGLLCLGFMGLSVLMGAGVSLMGAGLMWIMAEFFGRKKRAHLPTLMIALWFLYFVHRAAADFVPNISVGIGVMPSLVTLGAMLVFYLRFRLPFSIALIALSLLILAFSFFTGHIPTGLILLISGILFFLAALAYDANDTDRQTRFADNAFWLHFTAAPLILHGIMAYTLTIKNKTALAGLVKFPSLDNGDAIIMLVIVGVLAFIGLAINRRALLVSSLGYAVFAMAMLIKQTGLGFGTAIATAFLVLGILVVFLGAGWHGARGALLKILPTDGVFGKIFPPAAK